ncbi:dipeptidyl peptidase 1-like isoform X1 [Penaeus chinensis]|uniref:dipeptidyl peptidase 1-like isoform X1 n=2 Tax=Penaeus chinensis TaxID=139456 RepID=UPI001FB6D688|nr:dipeptidyl peptidase 1-like isoform X1 [Penaeus chinensis]
MRREICGRTVRRRLVDEMVLKSIFLLGCLTLASADIPVACYYEDIRGTWTFQETERSGDSSLSCDELGPVVHTKTFTLSFPDTVMDELGNEGTWTMISSQGFEVNINGRSYFAFSYYEGDWVNSISYCDRTFNGWSRDKTVRNWSCFKGQKNTKATPRVSKRPQRLEEQQYRVDHRHIAQINAIQTSWTARAYPQFEQYTLKEMQLRSGGRGATPPPASPPPPSSPELLARLNLLPETFDWRDVEGVNYVGGVRDQAQCGSCYVFASTAMLESRLRVKTRNQRQDVFSTQDVVSCSAVSQGCDGGFKYLIAGRYAMEQGMVAEECNPYTAQDDTCDTDLSCARTYVSEYSFLGGYYGGGSEDLMMEALVARGPMAVSYMVYDDFHNYEGGVYHHTGARSDFNPHEGTNHAVLLVGYGVDPATGEKYWTCRNSWGADWGEDGFFRIRRGSNECNIGSFAVEATPVP